jgi:hypothetical protein
MKTWAAVTMVAGTVLLGAGVPAMAMPESCQKDLNTYAEARMGAINRINGFKGKRPTATQACSAFGALVSSEDKMIKWMEANKEWCQIPDTLLADLKKGSAQGIKVRGQACSAAKKEAQMRAQARQGAPAAARPAVRLPQGAL